MISKKKRFWIRAGIVVAGLVLYGMSEKRLSYAARSDTVARVDTFEGLCREMSLPGKAVVELEKDIRITGKVSVYGEKTLRGLGHCLRRETGKKKVYGGTLFCACGTSLVLRDVIFNGGGESKNLSGRIYGRLLEVRRGMVTVEDGCVLEKNSSNGQRTDGGGAILIKNGGKLRITGGEIRGNHTAVGGAGIRVEKGAEFVMTGGNIVANHSEGVGMVEGFDGRGGGIYNRGRVEWRGGKGCYNKASAFGKKNDIYGGVGGMIYNAGECLVAGGQFVGNVSSQAGGGIYSGDGAVLVVVGGSWEGNRSGLGEDIFQAGGICRLNGYQKILRYERKTAGDSFGNESGQQKKNTSKPAASKKQINTGQQKNLKEQKTSEEPAAPKITAMPFYRNRLVFEQGEYVKTAILRKNVNRKCFKKQIKVKVQSVIRGGRTENWKGRLSTEKSGQGRIRYEIWQQGEIYFAECPFEIRRNHAPKIRVVERYFFTSEAVKYSERDWRKEILDEVVMSDDREKEAELREEAELDLGEILSGRAGTYTLHLKVRDQYGRRYYMKKGEKRRYGKGLSRRIDIPVVLAEGLAEGAVPEVGEVHFEQPAVTRSDRGLAEEVWNFKKEDIRKVKQYMRSLGDPFSREANDGFWKSFLYCRKGRVDE